MNKLKRELQQQYDTPIRLAMKSDKGTVVIRESGINSLVGSYVAASVFPVKVLKKARHFYRDGKLFPFHPQISLTNACNLNCEFCSCAEVDRAEELDFVKAESILWKLHSLGARVLTITGGGEPTLYPKFNQFIELVKDTLEMQVGMVTNGTTLKDIPDEILKRWTWCRVSVSDDRDIKTLLDSVVDAVRRAPEVDWAFSYVVTAEYDIEKIAQIVKMANEFNFTHVRLVSDLTNLNYVPDLGNVMMEMQNLVVDDRRVIYQGRKTSTRGTPNCLISLIKPFIGTDGKVYPCCGVQYAINDLSLNFDERLCMGEDLWDIYNKQKNFDGSVCDVCYYHHYNDLLYKLIMDVDHEDFL